ncbi:MAG: DoxX family membrane protein [Solirubrobacterales bacterium]
MKPLRAVLGFVFILAGALHFITPKFYEQMMPDWIPLHRESVAISGVAEIAGGVALLSNRTARFGFWWLAALLIAVFPANVHMATDPDSVPVVSRRDIPRWMLWARLPLQPLMIALLAVATRKT